MDRWQATSLVGVAIAGQAVAYVLSVLVARRLGVDGFEAYVVASAVFILLATFAPRGAEKYALRRLPAMLERRDWGRARGLLTFGLRRTILTSLVIGASVGVWIGWGGAHSDETRMAILVTCLSLPAGALAHYGVEVLSAMGRPMPTRAASACAMSKSSSTSAGICCASAARAVNSAATRTTRMCATPARSKATPADGRPAARGASTGSARTGFSVGRQPARHR